ncbi:MAG: nucleotidyltransferase domain-containing protein [Paludibacter sp.]
MDKTTALEHAQKYAQLVGEQLHPLKIVLFGSYANGNHTKNSDIDIAVIVNKIEDDFLDLSKQLNKFTRNIDSRIEPVLIQNDEDRSGFLSTILETGITLYQN